MLLSHGIKKMFIIITMKQDNGKNGKKEPVFRPAIVSYSMSTALLRNYYSTTLRNPSPSS